MAAKKKVDLAVVFGGGGGLPKMDSELGEEEPMEDEAGEDESLLGELSEKIGLSPDEVRELVRLAMQ